MTDWIEHNGGPQPVADDDWLEVLFPGTTSGWIVRAGNRMAVTWKGQSFKWRFINQHLIDAARLEGIRLGLEAAAKEVGAGRWRWTTREENLTWLEWSIRLKDVYKHCEILIRNLNPDTIAKEAQHD